MNFSIINIELLLLVASIVAMVVKKIRLPYAVGLVITGWAISASTYAPNVTITKNLIFNILLPPLIFEAAVFLPRKTLTKYFLVILLLATFGVILASIVTTFALNYFIGWPLISAAIFGILISATDPVSVIANFRESGINGRLRVLVEAESLFNDGTAAVLFSLMLIFFQGKSATLATILIQIGLEVGGGILCGFIIGTISVYFSKRAKDHLLEITFTSIAAYGSFLIADYFHSSGILAALIAGLVFGNQYLLQPNFAKNKVIIEIFLEYATFIANSLIFLLIGIHISHLPLLTFWHDSFIAVIIVLVGRAIAVYPLSFLFYTSKLRIPSKEQHIMFWGGLRGALGLGLALSLPKTVPLYNEIVNVTFTVVAFSIIVQGTTISWLIKFLGIQTK